MRDKGQHFSRETEGPCLVWTKDCRARLEGLRGHVRKIQSFLSSKSGRRISLGLLASQANQ